MQGTWLESILRFTISLHRNQVGRYSSFCRRDQTACIRERILGGDTKYTELESVFPCSELGRRARFGDVDLCQVSGLWTLILLSLYMRSLVSTVQIVGSTIFIHSAIVNIGQLTIIPIYSTGVAATVWCATTAPCNLNLGDYLKGRTH
jgi:hypothetical protein